MPKETGIKIVDSDGIHIFRISNYPTVDDYDKAWTDLTRNLEREGKWFTADPIFY